MCSLSHYLFFLLPYTPPHCGCPIGHSSLSQINVRIHWSDRRGLFWISWIRISPIWPIILPSWENYFLMWKWEFVFLGISCDGSMSCLGLGSLPSQVCRWRVWNLRCVISSLRSCCCCLVTWLAPALFSSSCYLSSLQSLWFEEIDQSILVLVIYIVISHVTYMYNVHASATS